MSDSIEDLGRFNFMDGPLVKELNSANYDWVYWLDSDFGFLKRVKRAKCILLGEDISSKDFDSICKELERLGYEKHGGGDIWVKGGKDVSLDA